MSDPQQQTEDITGPNQTRDEVEQRSGQEAGQESAELLTRLQEAEAKAEKFMRALAEADNQRKRFEREMEKIRAYALEDFAKELMQVWDSLELGQQAAMQEGVAVETLREGTQMTLKLLVDTMEKFGVSQLNPEGEVFNPEFHQAMAMQPREGAAPNTVVQVMQKGYLLNGRLLRPAMVIVAPA